MLPTISLTTGEDMLWQLPFSPDDCEVSVKTPTSISKLLTLDATSLSMQFKGKEAVGLASTARVTFNTVEYVLKDSEGKEKSVF